MHLSDVNIQTHFSFEGDFRMIAGTNCQSFRITVFSHIHCDFWLLWFSLISPSHFPSHLTRRPFLCHAGAFAQLLVGKVKAVLVDGETERFVGSNQCLAKSQSLLNHIAIHHVRPGSHQMNRFHHWLLSILPTFCGAVDSLVVINSNNAPWIKL